MYDGDTIMKLQEFVQRDVISQLLEAETGKWLLVEAKSKSKNNMQVPAAGGAQFLKSKLFDRTVEGRKAMMTNIEEKIAEFIATKTADPMQQFGSKDKPFGGDGPIGKAFPKMRYANMNSDIRLFYTMEGKNPTIFKLYGVFSHDDIGLGQPGNIKRQASFIQRLKPEVNSL